MHPYALIVLAAVAAIIAVFIVVAALQPSQFRIARTATVSASAAAGGSGGYDARIGPSRSPNAAGFLQARRPIPHRTRGRISGSTEVQRG